MFRWSAWFISFRLRRIFLLSLFIFFVKNTTAAPAIELVKNNQSEYSIILSLSASEQEQRAAFLLQKYIQKVSQTLLPIKENVNSSSIFIQEKKELTHPDAFQIKTKNGNLFFYGGSRKGCIYAVIHFLEKYLDCHYYSSVYKVIPKKKSILLPEIDETDAPANNVRIVNISDKLDDEFLDWNRLNNTLEIFAKGYYVHTFNKLLPWAEYFVTHPEYYALMNGKRTIDQLCLANTDVLMLTIEKLKKDMALQPDKLYWSVSQNDNFSYCQCDSCKKIIAEEKSPAGPVIRFVNEIAKTFPDKIISTLAYQYSRPAPVMTKPLPNVQIVLCTIELNRSRSIEEEKTSSSFLKDIQDWSKVSNRIYLWDYTIDFAHSISPFPNLHVLQPNIQFFTRHHIREHFQQSNISIGHEFSELKLYLISRLLWNPDLDAKMVENEFLKGFYGKAASHIQNYIDRLQSELKASNDGLDIYGHPVSHQKSFLSQENINAYNLFFDKAEKAVRKDSAQLMHVKVSRLPLQYAVMEIAKNDMFGKRGWYKETKGEFVPLKKMNRLLENFYNTCNQAKVGRLNESSLTPIAYYESTKRFIDVQVKGNLAFRKKVITDIPASPKYSNGDLSILTNGVRGANDYKVHWIGWEAKNFSLILDLEIPQSMTQIEISSLWDPKSWILHPASVACYVSADGINYLAIGKIENKTNQQKDEVTMLYSFKPSVEKYRYIKFDVEGTLKLPDWHPSAGGGSWVFVDEIVIK